MYPNYNWLFLQKKNIYNGVCTKFKIEHDIEIILQNFILRSKIK